jgi:IS5 family transposase
MGSIKNGEVPEQWKEQPNKRRQKDVDARWTMNNNTARYGYKNHAAVDQKTSSLRFTL